MPFWPFLAVRVFQGVGLAFFYTAAATFIANISPEAHRGQSLSYFFLAFNISFALSPTFGMVLINTFSFTLLFLLCIGISLVSLFLAGRLVKKTAGLSETGAAGNGPFLSRETIPSAIISFMAHMIWGALTAFFPLYALEHGAFNPGLSLPPFPSYLWVGLGCKDSRPLRQRRVILPCLTTYIISMIVLAFSESLPMFILVAVIWGSGNAFLVPTLVAHVLDRATTSPGPVMGTFTAIGDLGVALGPVIMAIILRSPAIVMFLCLVLLASSTELFLLLVRKRKDGQLPRTSRDPIEEEAVSSQFYPGDLKSKLEDKTQILLQRPKPKEPEDWPAPIRNPPRGFNPWFNM
jgi:MFS family permease